MQENVKWKIAAICSRANSSAARRNTFLCCALDDYVALQYSYNGAIAARRLQIEIEEVFEKSGVGRPATVAKWLQEFAGIPAGEIFIGGRLREYRLAWIDSWIAELKAGTKQ